MGIKNELLEKIECCRKQMTDLYYESTELSSDEMVSISTRLDHLLNTYSKIS
ncbi:aspartyl-phosphate phosphatase Spo0E family protein [Aquibacillus sp. 3ASR75-11]|uniref:Aspartyl-phosphate phosphatase Spo0E family protein n=1 Tax=Terrihalobacillus insolitus TaxID=2950438 RepID=A0A9X3WWM3_9BACI|nr:aspartyl-phosphate phosphatase Spo0E family protein [Terrihalobacillus insolitus]MDC3426148.1 aspartyl-phosphate phosphatase Spo0E family protein [Terrihalobacillus insolitus]